MAKKIFTVDIDDKSIRILLIKGDRVDKWASIDLEPGLVSAGRIVDEDKVASLLREQLKAAGIKSRRVIASLGGTDALYRLVDFPDLPSRVLAEAVAREAEKVMPLSLDESYLSHYAVPKSRGEVSVLMAAYPRDATEKLVRTMRKAGLTLARLDLTPIVLCRLITAPKAILVNQQGHNLDIAVIVDQVPNIIRSITLSGAEGPLADRLDAISDELDRTVAFYNSGHQDSPIDANAPLFATGDLLQSPESQQLVTDKLGYTATEPIMPVSAPAAFDPGPYMVNIALATKEMPRSFRAVNFEALPPALRPTQIKAFNIAAPVAAAVGLAALALILVINRNTSGEMDTLKAHEAALQTRIAGEQNQINSLNTAIKQAQDAIAPGESIVSAINAKQQSLSDSRISTSDDFAEIRALLPATMSLKSVTYSGGKVTVTGSSPTPLGVYIYARDIRDGRFKTTIVSSITESKTETRIPPPVGSPAGTEPTVVTKVSYDFTLALE